MEDILSDDILDDLHVMPSKRLFDKIDRLEEKERYALTFNINQYEMVNKKKWNRYTYDQQVGILTRMILSYQQECNYKVINDNMFFERNNEGVAHLHCVIEVPPNVPVILIQNFINSKRKKITFKDGNVYLACLIKKEFSSPGWYLYCTKDQQ